MARDDIEIKVVDRQTPGSEDIVDYQPFGVKILKLRIQRNQSKDPKPELKPIWVRPKGYVRPTDRSKGDPARRHVFGTAESDADLWVAWGAGDESGRAIGAHGLLQCFVQRLAIVSVALERSPTKCAELVHEVPQRHDLVGGPVELNAVVVDDDDQVLQAQLGGEHGSLPVLALVELAIAHQYEGPPLPATVARSPCHADTVGDSHTQGAG